MSIYHLMEKDQLIRTIEQMSKLIKELYAQLPKDK
jgi:hypothetical protein